jgi:hypothetical protein
VPLPKLIEPVIWVKRLGVINNGVERTPQALQDIDADEVANPTGGQGATHFM